MASALLALRTSRISRSTSSVSSNSCGAAVAHQHAAVKLGWAGVRPPTVLEPTRHTAGGLNRRDLVASCRSNAQKATLSRTLIVARSLSVDTLPLRSGCEVQVHTQRHKVMPKSPRLTGCQQLYCAPPTLGTHKPNCAWHIRNPRFRRAPQTRPACPPLRPPLMPPRPCA